MPSPPKYQNSTNKTQLGAIILKIPRKNDTRRHLSHYEFQKMYFKIFFELQVLLK